MLNPGQMLDIKYEVIKVLGQGGMGTVYLCKNSRLGNLWAVKEVNSKWKNQIDFLAEPNMLKNLNHIGIVRIIDIFYEDDNLYIVEDYIEGKTLKEHVNAKGPLSSELVQDISRQLCSILDYLHSFNPPIVYRDLKPSNIMIKPNNKVVLIDFGIARIYKESQEGDTMILGSKGYIAPEQLANIQSNTQTDIYSLGATMFFMLTGKSISLPTELMAEENYPKQATKSLVKVIQKATAIEPKSRYSNVALMLSDLNAVIADGEETVFHDPASEATTKRAFAAPIIPIIADGEQTVFMNSHKSVAMAPKKGALMAAKMLKKRTKLIIIALLACVIALIFYSVLMSKAAPKAAEKIAPKVEPTKEVVEKDTIVKGILDLGNPVKLNSGSSSGKGKGKDRNQNLLSFVLNPAASNSNSKLSISLIDIEVVNENEVIATLNLQNTADPALKLDLSKTYLVNGVNRSTKVSTPNSTNLLSIPQSPSKQELKLYFLDFEFEGSPYTLKTVLSSSINKNINLTVDINNP